MHTLIRICAEMCNTNSLVIVFEVEDFIFERLWEIIHDIIVIKNFLLTQENICNRGARQEISLRKRWQSHDHASSFCTLSREE